MTALYYVIGEPATGKSSLVQALTKHLFPIPVEDKQRWNKQTHKVPYVGLWKPMRYKPLAVELGVRRDSFGGTDALGMHMSPVMALWLKKQNFPVIIGEGDRCGNNTFFERITRDKIQLQVIHLHAAEGILSERRTARGSKQDPTWLASRRTMIAEIARKWKHLTVSIKSEGSVNRVKANVLRQLPELRAALEL